MTVFRARCVGPRRYDRLRSSQRLLFCDHSPRSRAQRSGRCRMTWPASGSRSSSGPYYVATILTQLVRRIAPTAWFCGDCLPARCNRRLDRAAQAGGRRERHRVVNSGSNFDCPAASAAFRGWLRGLRSMPSKCGGQAGSSSAGKPSGQSSAGQANRWHPGSGRTWRPQDVINGKAAIQPRRR